MDQDQNTQRASLLRIVAKALILFAVFNIAYVIFQPLPALGKLSIYNGIVPGRHRLPFGENPDQAYNLSLFQLDAMFASHEVSGPINHDEYRIFVIGDSSVWGILLKPEDTIAGQINRAKITAPDGRPVRAYNLGYPTLSVMKDFLMLNRAMRYEPDLIVWLVTLEGMPQSQQLSSPIVEHNAVELGQLELQEKLGVEGQLIYEIFLEGLIKSPWDLTFFGQRRDIADVVRLNLYGVMWGATGIDQVYPEDYERLQTDFEADDTFYNLRPPLKASDLSLDVIRSGIKLAGDVPVLVVNEPIYIGSGTNSDIRYNFYYPRWAYDDYRALMDEQVKLEGWWYIDAWDIVAPEEFTNTAIHYTPAGVRQVVKIIGAAISAGR